MNPYGPRAEVQVVDVFAKAPAAVNHSGNAFSHVPRRGRRGPFGAGVKDVEDLLESLPEVGAVTVTTTGATHDLACRANATFGVNVIEPSCDLRTSLGPGDWLRVGHNESHGRLRNEDAADLKPWAGSPDRRPPTRTRHVFTVVAVAHKPPYAITLSSPWPYASDANVALYEQGRGEKGERDAYRYVVTFDTLLGDLPPPSRRRSARNSGPRSRTASATATRRSGRWRRASTTRTSTTRPCRRPTTIQAARTT